MAFIRQLRRGNGLCPLAILYLGLRRPRRDIDFELNQEVHRPHPCAPRVLAAIPGGAMANVEGRDLAGRGRGLQHSDRPAGSPDTEVGHEGRSVPACYATMYEAYQAGQSSSRTRAA